MEPDRKKLPLMDMRTTTLSPTTTTTICDTTTAPSPAATTTVDSVPRHPHHHKLQQHHEDKESSSTLHSKSSLASAENMSFLRHDDKLESSKPNSQHCYDVDSKCHDSYDGYFRGEEILSQFRQPQVQNDSNRFSDGNALRESTTHRGRESSQHNVLSTRKYTSTFSPYTRRKGSEKECHRDSFPGKEKTSFSVCDRNPFMGNDRNYFIGSDRWMKKEDIKVQSSKITGVEYNDFSKSDICGNPEGQNVINSNNKNNKNRITRKRSVEDTMPNSLYGERSSLFVSGEERLQPGNIDGRHNDNDDDDDDDDDDDEEEERGDGSSDMGLGGVSGASRSSVPEEVRLKINSRERQRMHDINSALDSLRQVMPYSSGPGVKKLSKMSTLLLARNYILMLTSSLDQMKRLLQEMTLNGRAQPQPPLPSPTSNPHLLPDHAYFPSLLTSHAPSPYGIYIPSPLVHQTPPTHCVTSSGNLPCACLQCQRKNIIASVTIETKSKKAKS